MKRFGAGTLCLGLSSHGPRLVTLCQKALWHRAKAALSAGQRALQGGGWAERTGRSLMASPHVPQLNFFIWELYFDLWLSIKKKRERI